MLTLSQFTVSVGSKEIIHSLDHVFVTGQITAILGHNGSGKSSLALALMGHPRYVTTGGLTLGDHDISTMSPDLRQALGLFLSFQNIPEIPGIKIMEYLRTIYNLHYLRKFPTNKTPSPFVFRRMVEKMLPDFGLDPAFLDRELFVGFSGGEKRRIELLQIALLDPQVIILDEMDSGLDIDAIDILTQQIVKWRSIAKTVLVITHNFTLLSAINPDQILVLSAGSIVRHGDISLLSEIQKDGFQ